MAVELDFITYLLIFDMTNIGKMSCATAQMDEKEHLVFY